ncbi:MAG: extracellular solute-binding protein [Acidisphaera sp.]|nr:extracellular solute-binding protein [Acidisphaera sp.]
MLAPGRGRAEQVAEFWNYLGAGGELEAVNALLAVANKAYPATPISNRIIPGASIGLRQQLQTALMGGSPPAVSQYNTGSELRDAALSGRLLKINDVWNAVNGDKVFSEGMRRIVSIGNDHYAIPLSASIISNCWYNKAIFDKLSLKPPTSWDEFGDTCAKIKASGVTPLGAHSPPGYLFYQTYGPLLTVLGVDGFWAFTRGDLAFNGPELRRVFALFKQKIASNFSPTWSGSKWPDSVDQLMRGEVAMCLMGDWASGYMEQRGWKGGVQYDYFPVPGLEKLSIFQTDVVVAYKGDKEQTALNFLRVVASPEGQAAFNRYKNSLAVSADAPTDFYNEIGKREFTNMVRGGDYVALPNPYLLIPAGFNLDVATEVERYAATLDDAAFATALDTLDSKRQALKNAGKFVAW